MKEQKWIIGIVVGLLAAAGIFFSLSRSVTPPTEAQLAATAEDAAFGQFLKESGVIFYGAFWCPHCQRMKKDLGEAIWKPIYVECSTPDGKDETQQCKDAKIDSFPTVVFKDGTRQSGEMTREELVKRSGYIAPAVK
ncbi:MAG TPA: thioredoxin domain-containing protein [Candidatus Paceibacterota bacterium]|nr:thioredoxin domain-containing protein [Candidatus Paceibacterota bacterium]